MSELSETPITLILLVLNVFASGYAFFVDPESISRFSFRPRRIIDQKEYFRFISAGFFHGGIAHLAFNMITLYYFGPPLEAHLGAAYFLILYFGSELAAHALTMYFHKDDPYYSAIGASGAISGVVFAFCMYLPFAKLYIFFAIPMPAIVFAVLYVVGSIYAIRKTQEGSSMGRIAHEAHLGGAIGGVLLTILLDPSSVGIFLDQVLGLLG